MTGRGNWVTLLVSAIALVALAAGGTYAAVVNNWVPSITGTFYQESEYEAAVADAFSEGEAIGHRKGLSEGVAEGEAAGYTRGEQAGFEQGRDVGFDEGFAAGSRDGYDAGYLDGEADGQSSGYVDGYEIGWSDGCNALFTGLGTDRVGDWWDYFYSTSYGSYFTASACN